MLSSILFILLVRMFFHSFFGVQLLYVRCANLKSRNSLLQGVITFWENVRSFFLPSWYVQRTLYLFVLVYIGNAICIFDLYNPPCMHKRHKHTQEEISLRKRWGRTLSQATIHLNFPMLHFSYFLIRSVHTIFNCVVLQYYSLLFVAHSIDYYFCAVIWYFIVVRFFFVRLQVYQERSLEV